MKSIYVIQYLHFRETKVRKLLCVMGQINILGFVVVYDLSHNFSGAAFAIAKENTDTAWIDGCGWHQ